MAAALLNHLCGGEYEAESAGLEPGSLNPLAVEVMREIGIDIAQNPTKRALELFGAGRAFDYVITVCGAAESGRCPLFPGRAQRLSWPFDDPAALAGTPAELLAGTRVIRDAIKGRIDAWCAVFCGAGVAA